MKTKILLLEDDPGILELLEETFNDGSFQVVKAKTAEACRKALYTTPFELIILDRLLPDEDGLNIVKELKEHPCFRYTSSIVLSAKGLLSDRMEGLRCGADHYLAKPFFPEELLGRAKAILKLTAPMLDSISHLPNMVGFSKELVRLNEKKRFDLDCFGLHLTKYDSFKRTQNDKGQYFMQTFGETLYKELVAIDGQNLMAHINEDTFLLLGESNQAGVILDNINKRFQTLRKNILKPSPIEFLKKTNEKLLELKTTKIKLPRKNRVDYEEIASQLSQLKKDYSTSPLRIA